ncbi:KUP/HAK/KT family potassium transporter [Chitinophaga sp. S165]|uniref:KUP/HAK/KT family potassium transporter n=1 Tax=Chitinophaga sp. S165 TaxID=2135462 RepID=UPI000D70C58C|nr:KUP/HAK/KT family potassium transporter [Chitinophaga sp. S165]PWV49701.1 KUP system potassium uptake protein [Chitinophaga sp. S165]
MHASSPAVFHKQITAAGILIATGIVFGDIGTSPLYTLNAVFHDRVITEDVALGALSAIFWTLFFQTTLKYVIITLQADNKGEGGIFSLYALIRRFWGKWLVFPAMAGGAFLMADGIITPPISVASAIEGLEKINPHIDTVPIVICILIGLFLFQQFGTEKIGKIFGPVMAIWFTFIGVLGVMAVSHNPAVFKALNPYYAYVMLKEVPNGFWLLGSIFLCTTGAEALYSDMGHCGRNNIRVSWIYIKVMLILSYAGQTAWLLSHVGEEVGTISPFYHIVPDAIYLPALIIATLATIIASQALISGCFTLINEAIRLDLWPRHRVLFPGNIKGQLYIPFINWFLMLGCIGMVLHFRESTRMEAAFGLSVTLTMLMSTVLINFYLHAKRVPFVWIVLLTGFFLAIETSFLIANLQKIKEGGWITLVIGILLFMVMYIWKKGRYITNSLKKMLPVDGYIELIKRLSMDMNIPKHATNLVYLTSSGTPRKIEKTAIDSILSRSPKRADIYWFVHVNVLDEPYAMRYHVDTIVKNDVYFIEFNLGFRINPRIDYYFRQVVNDLVATKEVDVSERCEESYQDNRIGDYKFLLTDSFLSFENAMPFWKNLLMKSYFTLKYMSVKESVNFGLDMSNVSVEKYPVVIVPVSHPPLTREL